VGEEDSVELYQVMRTAFSAREFTDDPVPDELLHRIFEQARFAPSGGNRQGGQVIVVRDAATKRTIAELAEPAAKRYAAQRANRENPWNTIDPPRVTAKDVDATPAPRELTEPLANAPVVLVMCVDLKVVASVDQYLDRVGVISGASVYPFAWNILLAARNEGYGGTLTTMPIAEEPRLKVLLDIPEHVAVAAVIPFGRPIHSLTKLRRRAVEEFTHLERWGGGALEEPG
jgi:nitroreductase